MLCEGRVTEEELYYLDHLEIAKNMEIAQAMFKVSKMICRTHVHKLKEIKSA